MDVVEVALTLVGSFAAGIVGALTGLGGAVILVPYFTVVVNLPFKEAVALGLLSIVTNTAMSSAIYLRMGLVDDSRAPLYSAGAVAGGIVGAVISHYANDRVLALLFSTLIFYTSLRVAGVIGGELVEAEVPPSVPRSLGFGAIGGLIAGLIGVGGGVILIPLMVNFEHMPLRRIIATTAFLTAVGGSAALAVRVTQLAGYWYAPLVGVAAAAGSYAGAYIMVRLPKRTLQLTLAGVLAIVGTSLVLKVIWAWP